MAGPSPESLKTTTHKPYKHFVLPILKIEKNRSKISSHMAGQSPESFKTKISFNKGET